MLPHQKVRTQTPSDTA